MTKLADELDEIRRLGLTIKNVHHLGRAADMLRLLAAKSAAPVGFVLMPVEATREMTMAGCDSLPSCEHVFGHAGEMLRNAYRKMVSVAAAPPPSPPAPVGEAVSNEQLAEWLYYDCGVAVYACGELAEEIVKYFEVRVRQGVELVAPANPGNTEP